MSRLFQIKEDDLVALEASVPAIVDMAMERLDNNVARVRLRTIQRILSDVRWNYGPARDVTIIPADGDPSGRNGG